MSKTEPTFRDTKLWVISIEMIENIIFDNVVLVKSYIFENYRTLDFSIETLLNIHSLLCENLYKDAGKIRIHNVQVWDFTPMDYYKVQLALNDLDADIVVRVQHIKTQQEHKEFLAYVLWKILWIHPFFDYNWRVTRLFWDLYLLKNNLPLTTFQQVKRSQFTDAMKKATYEWTYDDIIELL